MALPDRIMKKLEPFRPLVAAIPTTKSNHYAWLVIYMISEENRGPQQIKYVVTYIELQEEYLHQYWEENIDIGGYKDCADYYESWEVSNEDDLERMVMERLDDPMLFLKPQTIPYKFPF